VRVLSSDFPDPVVASFFWKAAGAAVASSRFTPRVRTKAMMAIAATKITPAAIIFCKPDAPAVAFSTVEVRRWAAVPGLGRYKLLSLTRVGTSFAMFDPDARVVYSPLDSDDQE
jgi:hypothetical protein